MKILFLNLPYHGHIVPAVALVQERIRKAPGNGGGASLIMERIKEKNKWKSM